MNCPKCHRDTYSKKWGACTACAINEGERLTDAINTPTKQGNKPAGVHPVQVVRESVPDAQAPSLLPASLRTPNRRSRESYNTYMKGYMRTYRERSRG